MEMYKKASRMKITFKSNRGTLSLDDLWDLPLSGNDGFNLDSIAKGVNKQIKDSEEESFVSTKSVTSMVQVLRLDILKDIIATKLTEADEATNRIEKDEKRKKILAAIANKQESAFSEKTLEELESDLKSL